MNSLELHRILSRDPYTARYFIGVFPSDKIPVIHLTPAALVVNNQDSRHRGEHWLALWVIDNQTIEFFDSMGLTPSAYGRDISAFVNQYPVVHWNKIRLQSFTSNVCGAYCVYYIVNRSKGFSLNIVIRNLAGRRNDFRMFQFVKKRYGVNMIFRK